MAHLDVITMSLETLQGRFVIWPAGFSSYQLPAVDCEPTSCATSSSLYAWWGRSVVWSGPREMNVIKVQSHHRLACDLMVMKYEGSVVYVPS